MTAHLSRTLLVRPAIIVAALILAAVARGEGTNSIDLSELSLEELMCVKITSLARRPEPFFEAPAAVAVLTDEDLRRSGVTSIPEALRLVPGLEVARVDNHTWAITARGLNSVFSRFLLVMMDGRSLYSPLFSGVFWDVQDTMLEDIDRIEVIRGPGATLWGANAVNGVINIVTKSAKDTQGLLLTGGGGTEDLGFGGARFGGKIGDDAWFRVYAKGFVRDDAVFSDGHRAADEWDQARGGFRVDWEPGTDNEVTFQGALYAGSEGETFLIATNAPPTYERRFHDTIEVGGGYILSRWTHTFADASELTLQAYYDRTEREQEIFAENCDIVDLDLHHHFTLGERHQIVWGLGYRLAIDDVRNTEIVAMVPDHRTLQWSSGFVQDDIALIAERLRLSLGTKLEHNDYTGWEIQPGGRLAWTPTTRQTFWGAISRAVRTPSRSDTDIRFKQEPLASGIVPVIYGNPDFQSEDVVAYELGYRVQPHRRVTLDMALFYNLYNHVRSAERQGLDFSQTPPELMILEANNLSGETYGVELVTRWQVTDWWRLEGQYTFLKVDFDATPGSNDTNRELNTPQNQVTLRSTMDLGRQWEFDFALRFVDNIAGQKIPSYLLADVRLGWRPTPNLELAIVGQNLLDDRHPEFPSLFTTQRTEVEQSVYGKITWRY